MVYRLLGLRTIEKKRHYRLLSGKKFDYILERTHNRKWKYSLLKDGNVALTGMNVSKVRAIIEIVAAERRHKGLNI